MGQVDPFLDRNRISLVDLSLDEITERTAVFGEAQFPVEFAAVRCLGCIGIEILHLPVGNFLHEKMSFHL